jgi:hypothetical protein
MEDSINIKQKDKYEMGIQPCVALMPTHANARSKRK